MTKNLTKRQKSIRDELQKMNDRFGTEKRRHSKVVSTHDKGSPMSVSSQMALGRFAIEISQKSKKLHDEFEAIELRKEMRRNV